MVPRFVHRLYNVLDERVADMNVVDALHRANQIFATANRILLHHIEFGLSDGAFVLSRNTERHVAS